VRSLLTRGTPAFSAGLLAAGLISLAGWAEAAGFGFSPLQLYLGPRAASVTFTLKSEDTRTFRFQLSVAAWAQDAKGQMQLTPTKDIVVFPLLFMLEPGKERIVRVGMATPVATVEKTYRLIVRELPPLEKPDDPDDPTDNPTEDVQLRVLTGLSIPIFLQPARPTLKGQIDSLAVRKRKLSFHVNNLGNIHFQVKGVTVKGAGAAGENVFEQKLPGWYVLAGGVREYEVELSPTDCARTKRLAIEAPYERGAFNTQFELVQAGCIE
jgi:fimbrial chaperone protein